MFEMPQIHSNRRSSSNKEWNIQDQLQALIQNLSASVSSQCESMIRHIQKELSNFSNCHKEVSVSEQKRYNAKCRELQDQLEDKNKNNERYAISYAMNADQIQRLLEKNRQLERELEATQRQLSQQRMNKLDISKIPSSSHHQPNLSVSNELPNPEDSLSLTHFIDNNINNCEDEFHVMRNIMKMKKIKSDGGQRIDEFEWEPEKMFAQGQKKLAYSTELTKEGILFTNIVKDMKWSKFIIYQSLLHKKKKKFTFKIHQLRSNNFAIGIGFKGDLIDSQAVNREQQQRVLAFQPYAGKLKKYRFDQKDYRSLKRENKLICEMVVSIPERRVIWQESSTNILHIEAIPQEMIREDLVVYFELHRFEEKVELLLEQFESK